MLFYCEDALSLLKKEFPFKDKKVLWPSHLYNENSPLVSIDGLVQDWCNSIANALESFLH